MVQNPFYKGVQREAKTVIEGHFKEAYHLRYWNHVRGQNVGGLDPDTKRRPITPRKSGPIQWSDFARSHRQSILHGGPQILRSPGVLNLVYSPFTLVQGKRGPPRASRRSTLAEQSEASLVHPEPTTAEESPPIRKEEE